MDVTALTQVRSEGPVSKELIHVDTDAFSAELNKFTSHPRQKDRLDSAEDPSQSAGESELEDTVDEEDPIAFALIHPFLRLQSDIDSLTRGQASETIHIEQDTTDPFLMIDLLTNDLNGKELTESEMLMAELVPGETGDRQMDNFHFGKTEPVEEPRTEESLNKIKSFSIGRTATTDIIGDSSIVTELIDENKVITQEADAISTLNLVEDESEQPLVQHQGDRLKPEIKTTTTEETRLNHTDLSDTEQSTSMGTTLSLTDEIEPDAGNIIKTSSNQSVQPTKDLLNSGLILQDDGEDDTRQPAKEIRSAEQLFTNAMSFDQSVSIPVNHPVHGPVTKEQGTEMIQEMMMSVGTDEGGKEVFKSTLTLTPETLGEVKIELIYDQNGLSGKLVFESDETKKWMESQWQQMKQPLESKGLTISQFDFSVTKPVLQPQTDGFSFSQEFSQSDKQSDKQAHSFIDTSENAESNEDLVQVQRTDRAKGLNIYV